MRKSAILTVLTVVSLLVSSVLAESIEDKLTYQGNKARITVGRIKTKANGCSARMASSFGSDSDAVKQLLKTVKERGATRVQNCQF